MRFKPVHGPLVFFLEIVERDNDIKIVGKRKRLGAD